MAKKYKNKKGATGKKYTTYSDRIQVTYGDGSTPVSYTHLDVYKRQTELHKTGRIQPNRRDTYIAFAVTFVMVTVLAVARRM